MRNTKLRIPLAVMLAALVMFSTPKDALAVVQTLNGQTGQTQTFQNDQNVTISSSSNIHSLVWQGLLLYLEVERAQILLLPGLYCSLMDHP